MRILIVVPRFIPLTNLVDYRYLFPLGLAYISSTLKHAGHQVNCLNLNHCNGTVGDLINKALNQTQYEFVCTGGLSVHYSAIKSIVNAVRKHESNAGVVLGGGIMSSEPELMFNSLNPEFMVLGEGEKTIQELFACLEQKGSLEDINGIGYRDEDSKIFFW